MPLPILHQRDTLFTPTTDATPIVSLEHFPTCGKTNCVTSGLLDPPRLGCSSTNLTTHCLCDEAVAPLTCAPLGPSDDNNCWFELQQWFSNVCPQVKILDPRDMPNCVSKCALDAVVGQHCPADATTGTVTINCFCKLKDQAVINAVEACKRGSCPKHFRPAFNVTAWRENLCRQGFTSNYNQKAYDKYIQIANWIHLGTPIAVPIVAFILAGMIHCCRDKRKCLHFWITFIVLTAVLYGITVPLLYFVL